MRVCLVGDFSGNPDEGMKNVAKNLYTLLNKDNSMFFLDLSKPFDFKKLYELKLFNPVIIHYISGPSIFSILYLKLLKIITNNPKTVMSATHPKINNCFKYLAHLFKPNLILVQSERTEKFFKNIDYNTAFFPNGVDCDKFCPISHREKLELRSKYNINLDDFIILHVGHLKQKRNIEFLCDLQNNMDKVIIIGSTSTQSEKDILSKMNSYGCTIVNNFIENIQHYYQMADVYIFPTVDENNSIEIPLSILEALACGIPVISTRFGGIERLLEGEENILFIDSTEEIIDKVATIKKDYSKSTRLVTTKYDWKTLVEKLNELYRTI